jgi:hypothetical protein
MENKQALVKTLNQNTQLLLNCEDDAGSMKLAVDHIYKIYSQITGVRVDTIHQDKDILLPSGKAISTAAAAHCLLEMKRTAVFLRGINKAIIQKLSQAADKPIRILYAGTGPYGTLLTPLLPLYKSTDLKVDILDINRQSLIALHDLIGTLGLSKYVGDIFCTDATTFTVSKPYDIVISETMLACLRSEPQVAIMQNLIPQLTDDCIFIPEEISIDASLTNPKMEMDRLMYYETKQPPFERISLGNIFTVNKYRLDSSLYRKTLTIPDSKDAFPILKLFTTVKVFGDEILADNDSSITLPKQYYNLRGEEAKEIKFWYVQGEKPRIESCVVEPLRIHEIITI